jgi:hypothetical protein
MKNSSSRPAPNRHKKSNGNAISGLERPLKAEIDISPLPTIENGGRAIGMVRSKQKQDTMVAASSSEAICGLKRPQVAEIEIKSLWTIEKMHITRL